MKHYNILFSIPVHEQIPVIIDQLLNIFTYNDNCAVILHISKSFEIGKEEYNFFIATINKIGNTFINPKRMNSGLYNIIHTHLSNFIHIQNEIDFDYFVTLASNELFVKKGTYYYIKQFDYTAYTSSAKISSLAQSQKWFQMRMALNDDLLISKIKKIGGDTIYGGQIEGFFIRKELFYKTASFILSFYITPPKDKYAREEIYFHTFTSYLSGKDANCGHNITYINWDNQLIIQKKDIIKIQKKFTNFYSVKRINRDLNDINRIYIRRKGHYYKKERLLLNVKVYKYVHFNQITSIVIKKIIKSIRLLLRTIYRSTIKPISTSLKRKKYS